MAGMRARTSSTMMLTRSVFQPPLLHLRFSVRLFRAAPPVGGFRGVRWLGPATRYSAVRYDSTKSGGQDKKSPARLAEVQRLLYEAEERYKAAGGGAESAPKIALGGCWARSFQWKGKVGVIKHGILDGYRAAFWISIHLALILGSNCAGFIFDGNEKAIMHLVSALPCTVAEYMEIFNLQIMLL